MNKTTYAAVSSRLRCRSIHLSQCGETSNYTYVLCLDDKEIAKYDLKCKPDDIHELPFGLEIEFRNF